MVSSITTIARVIFVLLVLFTSSCSTVENITNFVPVQLTRVPHTEVYNQTFDITSSIDEQYPPLSEEQRKKKIDTNMDNIFMSLLGDKNWQYLKDLYGGGSIREEVIDGTVYIHGLINSTIYLEPKQHKKFIMEGSGRWLVINKKDQQILLSGDTHVRPEEYDLAQFKKGKLTIDLDLYVTRIPKRPSYYNKAKVIMELIVDTTQAEKEVFAINYIARHNLYIVHKDGTKTKFAYLVFEKSGHKYKIVDLRGIGFVENDYD